VVRGWLRWVLFVAILLAAGLGLYFKSLTDPGKESATLEVHPPQSVGVYVSNRDISAHLTAYISFSPGKIASPSQPTEASEALYLQVSAPASLSAATVLITSDTPIQTGWNFASMPVLMPGLRNTTIYGLLLPVGQVDKSETPVGAIISVCNLRNTVQATRGGLFIHLPDIGIWNPLVADPFPYPSVFPQFLSEYSPGTSRISGLIDVPQLKFSTLPGYNPSLPNPSEYKTPNGTPGSFFWNPKSLSTTQVLTKIGGYLRASQVQSVLPSGSLQGNEYIWQATGQLEPYLSTINQGFAASESNFTFLSGIAFGVGGAALIALVQEFPKEIQVPRRWRRKSKRTRQQAPSG
jgi:hypothetical protein